MAITINPDLQSLIPALTEEEYQQLETNLLTDGCRDPLTVWAETETLLDGHNRLEICERHHLPYPLQEISLPDLDAAKIWIIANQLGRRNLNPHQMSLYRGEQYNLIKKQGKRTDLTSPQSEEKSQSTSHALAAQHHVSHATIERDGAYAEAVEALVAVLGPEVRQIILAGDLKLGRQDMRALRGLVARSAEVAEAVREVFQSADPGPRLQALARTQYCGICERPLSDPASIARGIGPICAGHSNGAHGTRTGGAGPQGNGTALVLAAEAPEPEPTATTWPHNVSTGDYEWYTPKEIIALVKEVLGEIDVDPASCAVAQQVVGARTYYTIEDDGLRHPWRGTVFCNPPYKLPDIARFCGKLLEERAAGHTTAAILLVNNVTHTDWFQGIAPHADAICFPDGKICFTHATHEGLSPVQGQALLYFGPQVERFRAAFATLGLIMQVLEAKVAGPQLDLAEAPAPPPQDETVITRATAGSLTAAVWLTVKKLQPCSNAQVAQALGEPRNRTHQALGGLLKQGKIRKEGEQYRVVDAAGATP
jgi:DNA N-6-adenine-methyltransferase (Dam)/Family of unknown function (DUF6011)